ncbi:cell division protein ftsZ [Haloferax mucosum ATCC BAA-1512]|uniref:Tubulin-like protein CetZ n=1 Tax=Haloferax mucosum ATCC BAA-1512 TaxID=662479 RepID=M0I4R1_9EURY|nr:tubulin/FtsZ family protein [Haloferax mucosum]ELZ90374.1 cell division protein ftsZ [Haloferax mucosum ATCC BAA-1512]
MKVLCFGVGQAGGNVLDALIQYEQRTDGDFLIDAVAYNTASADLRGLQHVPESNRILFGADEVSGHGVGADNELAAELAERDSRQLLRGTDGTPTSQADAFMIFAGLGGGTGSGAAPVLAKHLKRIYDQPVYGVGILPAADEGGLYSRNAARSLKTFVDVTDHVFAFDNGAWADSGEDVAQAHDSMNETLVRRLGILLASGEVSDSGTVAESVVDSSEIINTLRGGGISTIGYAASELPDDGDDSGGFSIKGLLGKQSSSVDELDSINRITTQTRKAVLGRLTLPCDVDSAARGLVIVSGPSEWLNRKAIERSRTWVEEQTQSMEVRGGDYPVPESNHIGVLVLLGDVARSDRIKEIQSTAVDAQRNSESTHKATEQVVDERLDTLF